jgi:hypothetical protein
MRRGLLFSFLALGLVISFQNCGPQQLHMDFLTGTLVAKADDAFALGTSQSVSTGEIAAGEVTGDVAVADAPTSSTISEPGAAVEGAEGADSSTGTLEIPQPNYICVLEGQGNSVKVGFEQQGAQTADKTALDVCMTEQACLTIVSQHFPVKTAIKRDFCPNKKANVVSFSDDKLQELINQLNQTK